MTKQELAFDLILKKKNLFLTGKAGTGKTYLLNQLKEKLNDLGVIYYVCAPTGIAAINCGGATIHSTFQIPREVYNPSKSYNVYMTETFMSLKNLELLIIDEISMTRIDVLFCVHEFLQDIKGNKLPFGGVQLLLIGDLFQLPPVVTSSDKAALEDIYPKCGYYFLDALKLSGIECYIVELDEVYRQKDITFVNILNNIRNGTLTDTDQEILNGRVSREWDNSYTILTPYKDMPFKGAKYINDKELQKLDSEEKIYLAEVSGKFLESEYPTDEKLHLKVNAKVMICKNGEDLYGKSYYNGLIGLVTSLEDDAITIKAENGKDYNLGYETWSKIQYKTKKKARVQETIGSFKQIPVKLAWAITIHKSQGLTLDKVFLNPAAFAPGQTYVGLSRCKSLEGLKLANPINKKNVWIDASLTNYKEYFVEP